MLEKARIHRAMLRLDQTSAFTASDLAEETGAAITTVRKNLDRDLRAKWIATEPRERGGRVGRPEKFYRMTAAGRRQASREVDRAYEALSSAVEAEPEQEPATLTAGRQTLASLADPSLDRIAFLRRMRMAHAELSEAVLVATGRTKRAAQRLDDAVKSRLEEAVAVPEHDKAGWVVARARILERLEELEEPRASPWFDHLVSMLRRWREVDGARVDDLLRQISNAVRAVFPDRPTTYVVTGQEPLHFAEQPNRQWIKLNHSIPAPAQRLNLSSLTQPPGWQHEEKVLLRAA